MNRTNNFSLVVWIIALVSIGYALGLLTKTSVNGWYLTLNRSSLSPPNYIFGVVWTLLYIMLGISGWLIWKSRQFLGLDAIKQLFIVQLFLNWSWTPLFFYFNKINLALVCIVCLTALVWLLSILCFKSLKKVSLLLIPYGLWLLFASYLNLFIVLHN